MMCVYNIPNSIICLTRVSPTYTNFSCFIPTQFLLLPCCDNKDQVSLSCPAGWHHDFTSHLAFVDWYIDGLKIPCLFDFYAQGLTLAHAIEGVKGPCQAQWAAAKRSPMDILKMGIGWCLNALMIKLELFLAERCLFIWILDDLSIIWIRCCSVLGGRGHQLFPKTRDPAGLLFDCKIPLAIISNYDTTLSSEALSIGFNCIREADWQCWLNDIKSGPFALMMVDWPAL